MPFDPKDVDRLSPAARVEVQEWVLRRYFALRSPIPELCRRYDVRVRDRRKSVRDTLDPREKWPHPWDKYDSDRHGLASNILGATRG